MLRSAIRYFSTDSDVIRRVIKTRAVSRLSMYDTNAGNFITAVQNGEYKRAELMVKTRQVDINGHTISENTALTDAAKRGDTKAVLFLIQKLGANPHASCDCPYHKTALHYASENNHSDTVKALLQNGAQPNILDSRKYTALDVARSDEIRRMLLMHGGKMCENLTASEKDAVKLLPTKM
jgi:ankyrin repeat protein